MSLRVQSSQESLRSTASLPSLGSSDDSITNTEISDDEADPHQQYALRSPSRATSPTLPSLSAGPPGTLQESRADSDLTAHVPGSGTDSLHAPDEAAEVSGWITPPHDGSNVINNDHDGDGLHQSHLTTFATQVEASIVAPRNDLDKEDVDDVFDLTDVTDPLAGIGAQFDGVVL